VVALTQELYRQATALAAAITEGSGLYPTDVAALRALDAAAGAPVTVSQLGAELRLSSGAVTALVDRLERHGMVQRTRDACDRRRVHVSITPEARALGADLLEPIAARIGEAIADLDAAGLRVVRYLASAVDDRGSPACSCDGCARLTRRPRAG
jgi:DNA-binding MarR family transcriptional regulator